jgi:hypothetical protein
MLTKCFHALVRLLPVAFGLTALAALPQPGRFDFYERFVAIDGACGWPNLNLLPDGKLVTVIWPHSNHGFTEGSAESWLSTDGGRTWNRRGVPVPHQPGTNRMNVAAGAIDGRLVTVVGGWNKVVRFQPDGTYKSDGTRGLTIQPVTATSDDAGVTWRQLPEKSLPLRADGKALVPYGRVAKLADGSLGVCLYGDGVFFYTSADGGENWALRGTILSGKTHNETTWVRLDNGDLFAAVRTYGDMRLDAYRSTDEGRTWKMEGPITLSRQHPADLLKLPDGRVLLSYTTRNPGLYGIWVQIADPAIKAWSSPMMLVDLEGSTESQRNPAPSSDGGYPSTVQLADGTFVTVYYSRGIPAHQRYHVGVVRWRLPKNALPVIEGPAR